MTGAKWHGDCHREAIPGWHAVAYPTLFSSASVEILIHGSDDESDRPQAIADIWKDLPVLHELQYGTFFFVYFDNGKGLDWTSNNKVPLGKRCIILIVVGWDKAYCSKAKSEGLLGSTRNLGILAYT